MNRTPSASTRSTASSLRLRAAVFDMDGVVTDTAHLHATAWKELIDGYLRSLEQRMGRRFVPFDEDRDYRRYVDGKPRQDGLRSFLKARDIPVPEGSPGDGPETETVHGLAARKDQIFQQVLEREGVETLTGTVELIHRLRDAGVRTAVASSSRNCGPVLERAGLTELFEARVDGVTLDREGIQGKPAPEMFVEATRRLDADPGQTAVFEDAVSGIEAARSGAFGLVLGVATGETVRWTLREAGADLVRTPDELGRTDVDDLDAWFREGEHRLPAVPTRWDELRQRLAGRRPALFLDYDGTLTPIVARPDAATLTARMRRVLEALSERWPVTVVSGRGRDDVERLVGLEQLHYAGSHGFDIRAAGLEGEEIRHQAAERVEPEIRRAAEALEVRLAGIDGALVEPKRYTVAVHYRQVRDQEVSRVNEVVEEVLERHPDLRKAHGKKVVELRPDLDWDKGLAVLWLLQALDLDGPAWVPLYLGDDTTDEDAFRALEGRGIGILVADRPQASAARYQLQDPAEVGTFLRRLVQLET